MSRIWIFGLALLMFVISLVTMMTWIVVGPVLPAYSLAAVQGASRSEVVGVLGMPSEVQPDGNWIYTRVGNHGWVRIVFDENQHVKWVDDESVFSAKGFGLW